MMRMIGAVLVAAGCAWLGFQAADGLRRRSRSLEQAAQALGVMERELELGGPPLPQLLERAARRLNLSYAELERITDQTFQEFLHHE